MKSSHFVEKCRECGVVVTQCRCPSPDKTVILTLCRNCAPKSDPPRDGDRRPWRPRG